MNLTGDDGTRYEVVGPYHGQPGDLIVRRAEGGDDAVVALYAELAQRFYLDATMERAEAEQVFREALAAERERVARLAQEDMRGRMVLDEDGGMMAPEPHPWTEIEREAR